MRSNERMGLSRQEVNLRRLLAKCELMCKSKKEDDRIEKYVETLEDMLQEVKKLSDETIANYNRRIGAIKTAVGITTNKYEDEHDPEFMRSDLLGLRQRNIELSSKPEAGDLDQVINYHENMQKKITDDMLHLTRSLREQSETANKIIRKDTEVVSRSAQLTEQNYAQLAKESQKLAEHSKRAWKCWMWIMLAVVMIIFINSGPRNFERNTATSWTNPSLQKPFGSSGAPKLWGKEPWRPEPMTERWPSPQVVSRPFSGNLAMGPICPPPPGLNSYPDSRFNSSMRKY